jgi:hypothetical protein
MLGQFDTADLDQISGTATNDRIDTKFVLRDSELFELLSGLAGSYRVLDIDGRRYTTYRTQYFDTESLPYSGVTTPGAAIGIKCVHVPI